MAQHHRQGVNLSLWLLGVALGSYGAVLAIDSLFPLPETPRLSYSVEVQDSDGEPLRLYTTAKGYWRLPIRDVIPDRRFLDMLLAYEDKRFKQHTGVDPLALGRAAWQALSQGRIVSGASTITMQTVRLLEPRPRTLATKLVEMGRAWQLEQRLDKGAILDLYLDLAPYGGNLQGVRAASLFYFGKEPVHLSVAEAALLVALPQSPESRRPDRFPEQARHARDTVLLRMLEIGAISVHEAERASTQPIPKSRRSTPFLAPHLTDRLRQQWPTARVVRTTLDGRLQRRLEQRFRRVQHRYAQGVTLAALVVHNASGEVRAYVGSGGYFGEHFPGQVDMVQAVRSPGSVLKPFIYGQGFEQGIIHPDTLINDGPGSINGYAPQNFDGEFRGEMLVREALATSRNLPAVRLLHRLGPVQFTRQLESAGVTLRLPGALKRPGLPIALGGVGVTLEDLVTLYAAIANGGEARRLRFGQDASGPSPARLLSPAAAWYLTDILSQSPLPSGTLRSTDHLAFKTGTSYGYRDAWALGFNADFTVGVWVGRPDGGYTAGLSGLVTAVPLLFEAFGLLPRSGVRKLLKQRPPNVLLATNSGLPPTLRRFDPDRRTAGERTRVLSTGPSIRYPTNGSLVELAEEGSIQVEVRGGVLPYHWLINSRYIASSKQSSQYVWHPRTDGPVAISVMDSKGRSARVGFVVQGSGTDEIASP